MQFTKILEGVVVTALLILFVLPPPSTIAIERHPRDLSNLINRELYSYSKLIEWLNYTGIAREMIINISDHRDIVLNSDKILKKVYNNGTLAFFVGGLQLKTLKIFTRTSTNIEIDDILTLLKTIAKNLGISSITGGCSDTFHKFLINLRNPRHCNYDLSDFDRVLEYVVELGKGIPESYLASVVSKILIIKIAAQGVAIYRDALNSILNKLLYEDSIVLYLMISDFINTANITIVDRGSTALDNQNTVLKESKEASGTSAKIILTSEDVGRLLDRLVYILALAEKYHISISLEDVFQALSYVISLGPEKAISLLQTIDIGAVGSVDVGDIPLESIDGVEVMLMDIMKSALRTSYPRHYAIDIPPGVIDYIEFYETYMDYKSLDEYVLNVRRNNGKDGAERGTVMSLDEYLYELKKHAIGVLNTVVNKIKDADIYLPKYGVDNYTQNWANNSRSRQNRVSESVSSIVRSNEATFYIVLFIATVVIAIAVYRWRGLLEILTRFIKSSGVKNLKSYGAKPQSGGLFEYFWILIHKLAARLGVEVRSSDTHREAYSRIAIKIENSILRQRLRDIVMGYEVLRFSDRVYIDKDLWLKTVVETMKDMHS